ncbi:hypothetical protein FDA25_16790 [Clostridium botulinum]|nr:hypothetical protein [Clostridium botulinum]NFJ73695.1 hypothetical protein [Clostridium botulinum]
MPKVMISIPLTKYLREFQKFYGDCFITKTKGGQVYISNESPGDIEDEGKTITFYDGEKYKVGLNEVEFNDSDFYQRLPKEIHQHFNMKNGSIKSVKDLINEIKKLEKGN